MKLENLAMPPFNTTLMGVLKGALDYYGIETSAAKAFGLSGHAFLINIHEQLCPSGPYCWNGEPARPLIENLGLRVTGLGFFGPGSAATERAAVEQRLRDALDARVPCSLLNLENQLILGYDETGFITAQPWAPKADFPPARLSFGSWRELGDSFHMNFYVFERAKPADPAAAILASLDYAVDLHRNPSKHSWPCYGIGPDAYANWISAAPECGSSHGNWWNATVWSECRRMASEYFAEMRGWPGGVAQTAAGLSVAYAAIADNLARLSDKEMDVAEKVALLQETQGKEAAAIEKVVDLADNFDRSRTTGRIRN